MENLRFEKRAELKQKPTDESSLGFGKLTTDYMLAINYTGAKGWHDARIVPYGPLSLDPATSSLHYGQLIFEGLKAYKTGGGEIVMFRPRENIKRMNTGLERLCIPTLDEDFTLDAIRELVNTERGWIPSGDGTSLYIRPFILATDPVLGVTASDSYLFLTILSPVGSYYKEGMSPVRIFVEDKYTRAGAGGTGYAKCAGNYAGTMLAQKLAAANGYAQVMWLDGKERRYVEEIGTSNAFFVISGEVITPPTSETILAGITRKSSVELLRSLGYTVTERPITTDEVYDAYKAGRLDEAFATGTAAVVSPIGELGWKDEVMKLTGGKIGKVAQTLYDELTGIQLCKKADPFGWVYRV
ncbi:MAG: branched-chain amino acid aminotransferase [Oscillospiraceae bacterium]|nr:branched-chain amino acid aminotransferase [Oscillospiraceae bacterium]